MCNTHRDRYAQDTKHGTYESLDAAVWKKDYIWLGWWSTDIQFVDTKGIHKESQPAHVSFSRKSFPMIIYIKNLWYRQSFNIILLVMWCINIIAVLVDPRDKHERVVYLLFPCLERGWWQGPSTWILSLEKTPFPLVKGSGHISAVHPTDRLRTLTRRT